MKCDQSGEDVAATNLITHHTNGTSLVLLELEIGALGDAYQTPELVARTGASDNLQQPWARTQDHRSTVDLLLISSYYSVVRYFRYSCTGLRTL